MSPWVSLVASNSNKQCYVVEYFCIFILTFRKKSLLLLHVIGGCGHYFGVTIYLLELVLESKNQIRRYRLKNDPVVLLFLGWSRCQTTIKLIK